MKKFDPTKPVRTLSGKPARIICTDADDESFPIIGLIKNSKENREDILTFTKNGKVLDDSNYSCNDLENIPERKVFYQNIYSYPEKRKPGRGIFTEHFFCPNLGQTDCKFSTVKYVFEDNKLIETSVVNEEELDGKA
jgi:hypothetical protein